jgi:hypothetical protein
MAIRESRIGSEANSDQPQRIARGAQTLRAGSLLATPKYQKGSPPPAHTLRVFDAQLDADRDPAWFDISLARFLRAVCKKRAKYRVRPARTWYSCRYTAKRLNLFGVYRVYRLYRLYICCCIINNFYGREGNCSFRPVRPVQTATTQKPCQLAVCVTICPKLSKNLTLCVTSARPQKPNWLIYQRNPSLARMVQLLTRARRTHRSTDR